MAAAARPDRPARTMACSPRGTGVSVTRRSPKPQRQVRFLGPPLAWQRRMPEKHVTLAVVESTPGRQATAGDVLRNDSWDTRADTRGRRPNGDLPEVSRTPGSITKSAGRRRRSVGCQPPGDGPSARRWRGQLGDRWRRVEDEAGTDLAPPTPVLEDCAESGRRGSNPQPPRWNRGVLPPAPRPRSARKHRTIWLSSLS